MKEGSDLPKQLYSYRDFPSRRSKYCYVLPVTPDTTYLLRGSKGNPFINSIELRGLPDTSYSVTRGHESTPQFIVLGDRLNMGTEPGDDSFFRFPDEFDRIWWSAAAPRYQFPSFATVNGSLTKNLTFDDTYYPNSGTDDGYNWPPNRTLVDAWVGKELSFQIPRKRDDTNKVYAAFYIMEVRPELILVNVSQESGSTDGIILNGFEYYYRYDFNYSATFSIDETALDELQVSFGLQDWQGDPCFPVAWDWLTCDPITTRIIKLNLSHMNITGSISANISSLGELTEIYLDNNNLQGSIPESLALLTNLTVLAQDNNKLTGEIPPELLSRPGLNFT
ncbi:hypothetical protein R1sor_004487 [Riccia sorocarpa]|uniref:Malectin-like domain-containing protein n=1 Tax=Riccia sorocarpa TaxID=122646 RepID=A0ABD3HL54_9MARC